MVGGMGERELQEAGATAVYGNPSELLQDLEASPVGVLLAGGTLGQGGQQEASR